MNFTLDEFKESFAKHYGYISHSQTDEQLEQYLEDCKSETLEKAMDLFQDYLLSQGLCDVQL